MATHDLIFVYGTLLSGTGSRMSRWLASQADFVDQGQFQGRLFRIGNYPGVVSSKRPVDRVRGEIYRVRNPAHSLAQLDAYENYDPARPSQSEYLRVLRPVRLRRGGTLDCWVYVYNRRRSRLPRIASGNFLRVPRLQQGIRRMEQTSRSRWVG